MIPIHKKILISILLVALMATIIGGATLAWFTAQAEVENQFTAGTVMIEAGSTVIKSQNFDPASAVYLYGIEWQTGDLYEIDVLGGSVHKFFDTPVNVLNPSDYPTSPNGLGFDSANRRLYFSVTKGAKSDLYFYDFKDKKLVKSGIIPGVIYGATFGQGYYWYIKHQTDELWHVSFDNSGLVVSSAEYDKITKGVKKFALGDVALDIRDGVLYGSTSGASGTAPAEFFKYIISTKTYEKVTGANAVNLQIAFGSDGILYGHNAVGKSWYKINKDDGSWVSQPHIDPGNRRFQDVASGYISVWNPGDCEAIRYYVRNTGTKKSYVRLTSLVGEWKDEEGIPWIPPEGCATDVVTFKDGNNNEITFPIYYMDELLPGIIAEFYIMVCLSGPDTCNEYQGKSFVITATFDAIQSSNEASEHEWGWSPD